MKWPDAMKEMHPYDTVVDKAGQLLFAGLRTKISMFHGEMTKVVPHTTTGPLTFACMHACFQGTAGVTELADPKRLLLQVEQTILVLQVSCMPLAHLELGLSSKTRPRLLWACSAAVNRAARFLGAACGGQVLAEKRLVEMVVQHWEEQVVRWGIALTCLHSHSAAQTCQ